MSHLYLHSLACGALLGAIIVGTVALSRDEGAPIVTIVLWLCSIAFFLNLMLLVVYLIRFAEASHA